MAKRTAAEEAELIDTVQRKQARVQAPSLDPVTKSLRQAYITSDGSLSPTPITIIALNEDAEYHTVFYWPQNEAIGRALIKALEEDGNETITLAVVALGMGDTANWEDDRAALCAHFEIKDLCELGVFRSDISVDERKDLDPLRYHIVVRNWC